MRALLTTSIGIFSLLALANAAMANSENTETTPQPTATVPTAPVEIDKDQTMSIEDQASPDVDNRSGQTLQRRPVTEEQPQQN